MACKGRGNLHPSQPRTRERLANTVEKGELGEGKCVKVCESLFQEEPTRGVTCGACRSLSRDCMLQAKWDPPGLIGLKQRKSEYAMPGKEEMGGKSSKPTPLEWG